MFHNVHAYIALKTLNNPNPWLIIGSILPDLAITKIISWEDGLHGFDNTAKFQEHLIKSKFLNTQFSTGILIHNIVDELTHNSYKDSIGYAYLDNKELTRLVGKYYQLDVDRSQGIAHNYIESAVDILLLSKFPEIQGIIYNSAERIDIGKLSNLLSDYFNKNQNEVLDSLEEFLVLFTKYDFTKKENWILFWEEIDEKLALKSISYSEHIALLNEAINITHDTYTVFLNKAIKEARSKYKTTIDN